MEALLLPRGSRQFGDQAGCLLPYGCLPRCGSHPRTEWIGEGGKTEW